MQVNSKSVIALVAIATDAEHNITSQWTYYFDTVEDAKAKAEVLLMDDAYGDGGRVFYYNVSMNECTHDVADAPADAPESETE